MDVSASATEPGVARAVERGPRCNTAEVEAGLGLSAMTARRSSGGFSRRAVARVLRCHTGCVRRAFRGRLRVDVRELMHVSCRVRFYVYVYAYVYVHICRTWLLSEPC